MNSLYKIIFSVAMFICCAPVYCMNIWDAIECQDVARVQELITQDSSVVNAISFWHVTPLHVAVQWDNKEIVAILIKAGADINARHEISNETLLHIAVSRNNKYIVEMLIKAGAHVNASNLGFTPLHRVAFWGNDEQIVAILIAAGADMNAQDEYEHVTPLQYAEQLGNKHMASILRDYQQRIEEARNSVQGTMTAFAQGQHPRLGAASPVALIDANTADVIGRFLSQQAEYEARHKQERSSTGYCIIS